MSAAVSVAQSSAPALKVACPQCAGAGTIPNIVTLGTRALCSLCRGSRQVRPEVVETWRRELARAGEAEE